MEKKVMSRRTILLVGIALMVTGMAMGQNPLRKYIDLRPDLAKKKFTEGKHLIKTLPDGRKVSLGFKAGKVVEIFLTDKNGKEMKEVLAEGKVSREPPPPEAQMTPRLVHKLTLDLCFDASGPCRNAIDFVSDTTVFVTPSGQFVDSETVIIEIQTCCG